MPKPDTGPDERMALARRWDQLVDAVRSAGYDDFLRPLPPDRLLPAAEGDPSSPSTSASGVATL